MSLLWRDRYVAVLTPERAALVRRRGRKGTFDLRLDAPCPAATPAGAAAALAELVKRPEVGRGNLTLLLSNHFVRYLLVPWRSEVRDPAEFAAFADICWDRTYGGDPARRVLRTAREKSGSPRLAAALDADFLAALREAVSQSPLKLMSVQPYLTAAFNRLGSAWRRRDFLFLVAEPDRTCLLAALGGAWKSVRAGSGGDSPENLSTFLEREIRLLGLDEGSMPPVFIHAPRQARLELPPCNGVMARSLPLPIPPSLADPADSLLTMAMAVH
ncbi:MAG: hypothetical protein ACM31P_05235 [Actinomycetota bacterium]